LSDQQQRAEYDRLLELAKRQQAEQSRQSRRRSRFGTVRWLAADALLSAVVSLMLIGGYFVYRSAERSPLSSEALAVEMTKAEPAQAVVLRPTGITEASSRAIQYAEPLAPGLKTNNPEPGIDQQAASKPASPEAPAPVTDGAAAIAFATPPGDNGAKDIAFYRERGMRAYRSGELYLALANFGVAIDLDPGSPDSYVDRGIVFHRLGDLKRALSDVAEAKRLDDLNRKQSAQRMGTP
jgi:hypothetical protein